MYSPNNNGALIIIFIIIICIFISSYVTIYGYEINTLITLWIVTCGFIAIFIGMIILRFYYKKINKKYL
jgi:quinol-cytochrome oxidoreductase complex cytochrome b subunit